MEDETKLQRFIHRYSEDAKPLHFNEFINMETAGLSIHISLWGGGDLYPPIGEGTKVRWWEWRMILDKCGKWYINL